MTRKKTAVLLNPSAGKGRALALKSKLEKNLSAFSIPYDLYITQSEEHLRKLTRELSRKYGILTGAGGDSTFHIMANELMKTDSRPLLGLIGIGSSNDITREFNLTDIKKACLALKSGCSRTVDLGCIYKENRRVCYFFGQANIGLGAHVNWYVEKLARKKPWLGKKQLLAGILAIRSAYRRRKIPLSLSVTSSGIRESGRYVAAVFSNIRFWASGRCLLPQAQPDDGLLDACLIKECSLPRLARLNTLTRRQKHIRTEEMSFYQIKEVTASSDTPFTIQADGEIIGDSGRPETFTYAVFRAVPGALRIISGKKER